MALRAFWHSTVDVNKMLTHYAFWNHYATMFLTYEPQDYITSYMCHREYHYKI